MNCFCKPLLIAILLSAPYVLQAMQPRTIAEGQSIQQRLESTDTEDLAIVQLALIPNPTTAQINELLQPLGRNVDIPVVRAVAQALHTALQEGKSRQKLVECVIGALCMRGQSATIEGMQLVEQRAGKIVILCCPSMPEERPTCLMDMPQEILDEITRNLSQNHKDVANLRRTCTRFNKPSNQDNGLVRVFSMPTNLRSYLSVKDLGCLRQTCRSLRGVWGNNCSIKISGTKKLSQMVALLHAMHVDNPIELNLSYNCLTDLPDCIKQLTRLKKLNLDNNPLTPQAIVRLCTSCPQLEELNLGYNRQTPLPDCLKQLVELKKLDLRCTGLVDADVIQICECCPGLEELNVSGNSINNLPVRISKLTKLKKLYVGGNRLTDEAIVRACTCCPQLEELGLHGIGLTDLPECLKLLTQLKKLYLGGNELTQEEVGLLRTELPGVDIRF